MTVITPETIMAPDDDPGITPEVAQKLVFENWNLIKKLARKRFENNEFLQEEAIDYVLDKLSKENWSTVRKWNENKSQFSTYLTKICHTKFIDFSRHIYGHYRMPKWLKEKEDPLWKKTYKVLEKYYFNKHEAIQELLIEEPLREKSFIEDIISTILAGIKSRPKAQTYTVSLDDEEQVKNLDVMEASVDSKPDHELVPSRKEIAQVLQVYLESDDDEDKLPDKIQDMLRRLKPKLKITNEEHMLLKLRHKSGFTIESIKGIMGLQGDINYRIKKLEKQLNKVFEEVFGENFLKNL